MGVPGGYYERLAVSFGDAGFAVAVADLRGTGESIPTPSRGSLYGYQELVDDIGAVLEALAPQREGRKTILLGHSLGGQACVMRLARSQQGVDGLVLVAVGMPYWRIYGRQRLGVFGYTQGITALTALLRVWPGWSFGGKQARGVIRDWGYTGRHGAFPPLTNR
jgi:predicted alpha/beta hydrolase